METYLAPFDDVKVQTMASSVERQHRLKYHIFTTVVDDDT